MDGEDVFQPGDDLGILEGGGLHDLADLAPVGAEVEEDGLAAGQGFADERLEVAGGGLGKVDVAENGAAGDGFGGVHRQGGGSQRAVGVPGVVGGQQQDEDAEGLLDLFHPGAGLRQDGEAGGGQGPGQGHADAQQKRQGEGHADALGIERAGQRQHGDQDRCDTGPGQQSGNAAQHQDGGQPCASGKSAGPAEAAEINLPDIEHRQGQDEEQRGDAGVEDGRGIDGAEDGAGQHDDEAERAIHQGHAETVDEAEAEADMARRIGAAGADDGQVDGNHGQDARSQVQQESADQDEQNGGKHPVAKIEFAGIVEKQRPGRRAGLGLGRGGGGIEKREKSRGIGVADKAGGFAAGGEKFGPGRCFGGRIEAGGRRGGRDGAGVRRGGSSGVGGGADRQGDFFGQEAQFALAALIGHHDGFRGRRGVEGRKGGRIAGLEIPGLEGIRFRDGQRRQGVAVGGGDREAGIEVVIRRNLEGNAQGGAAVMGGAFGRHAERRGRRGHGAETDEDGDFPQRGKLFSTAWKTGCVVFHSAKKIPRIFHRVENFFPWRGKIARKFSMAWKTGLLPGQGHSGLPVRSDSAGAFVSVIIITETGGNQVRGGAGGNQSAAGSGSWSVAREGRGRPSRAASMSARRIGQGSNPA